MQLLLSLEARSPSFWDLVLCGAELRLLFHYDSCARGEQQALWRGSHKTMSEIDSLFAMMDGGDVDAGRYFVYMSNGWRGFCWIQKPEGGREKRLKWDIGHHGFAAPAACAWAADARTWLEGSI